VTSLGLRKGEIRICQHDPAWLLEADQVCGEIRKLAGCYLVDVQHVGSTSVPGLPAKPILDFAIGVDDTEDLGELRSCLTAMGYLDRGLGASSIGHLLVREIEKDVRTQHVHILEHGSEHWFHYTLMRDHLISDDENRARLRDLKQELVRSEVTRAEYQRQKSLLVQELLLRIVGKHA